MPVEIKGLQELIDTFHDTSQISNKAANRALEKAGETVKDKMVEVARSTHSRYSKNVGWREIKKYPIRSKKSRKTVSVGLKSNGQAFSKSKSGARTTHWDKVKGLWYNNYGFHNVRTGKFVAGSGWIDKAYDDSVEDAYKEITEELLKGLFK